MSARDRNGAARSLGGLLLDLTPLRDSRDFRLLYAGHVVSLIAIGIQGVALGLQVYELTGSSVQVGLVSLSLAVPMLALLPLGGVLADRCDRRRQLLLARTGFAATVCILLANSLLAVPRTWPIFLAAALSGVATGISAPALIASIPALVGRGRLAAAGALNAVAGQIGLLLGPLLAGVALAWAGIAACYALAAFGASAALLFLARMRPMPPAARAGTSAGILVAWRFIRAHRLVAGLLLVDLSGLLFAMPLALYPEFGLRDLGGDAATVSLLHAATAFGALLAGLTSGRAARTTRSGRVLIAAVLAWGAATAMLGLAPGLAAALLCIAVAGMGLTIAEILRGAMLQQATPDHLLGRVGSLWSMQATLAPALGGMVAALLARPLGAGAAITLGGVLCVAGTLLVAAGFPELRRAGQRP